MMIDNAFRNVENPKPHQHGTGKQLARPAHVTSMRSFPQLDQSQEDENICTQVKNAVPEGVQFEIGNTGRGITAAREHMIPLENLMQNNPIEEAAQPKSEQYTR